MLGPHKGSLISKRAPFVRYVNRWIPLLIDVFLVRLWSLPELNMVELFPGGHRFLDLYRNTCCHLAIPGLPLASVPWWLYRIICGLFMIWMDLSLIGSTFSRMAVVGIQVIQLCHWHRGQRFLHRMDRCLRQDLWLDFNKTSIELSWQLLVQSWLGLWKTVPRVPYGLTVPMSVWEFIRF